MKTKLSVMVKISVFYTLLGVHALPGKTIPKMTYIVSDGTLNSTHSFTLTNQLCLCYDKYFIMFSVA